MLIDGYISQDLGAKVSEALEILAINDGFSSSYRRLM
jgi:hypothetical protein